MGGVGSSVGVCEVGEAHKFSGLRDLHDSNSPLHMKGASDPAERQGEMLVWGGPGGRG
jgi:hypothetical protein